MEVAWKQNWDETRRHFTDWWHHEGLVVSTWTMPAIGGPCADSPHETVEPPASVPRTDERYYSDTAARAQRNHHFLSLLDYPLDLFPIADTDAGPGSLALCLGSEPDLAPDTVWFRPTMQDEPEPERLQPVRFDPENRWWKIHEATVRDCAELARGKYLVGCPDLVENIDVLASLRGMTNLFLDMYDRPGWVTEKLAEINQAYFEVYDRIHDIISLEDGSSAFCAYQLWGPGKTAKVQCDAAALISPDLFSKFTVPFLREQCAFLDYSMYHLDGTEQFCQLDALLEIEELDAIEFSPNAKLPFGGDPQWFDLYRRILDAGKSVQVYLVLARQVLPLLDAIGGDGVYVLGLFGNQADIDTASSTVEQFR